MVTTRAINNINKQTHIQELTAAVCMWAVELCEAAVEESYHLETSQALVQAFDELTASRDELVGVWAIVQLTSFAAKQVAERKPLEEEEEG